MSLDNYLYELLHLPKLNQPKVSPDGKWVAWTWLDIGPVGDIYIATTDGSKEPTRITNTGQHTWVASWLSDSLGLVIYHDRDGDEKDQLFKLRLEKPEQLLPLTDEQSSYFIRGGQIHPEKPWLFYCANYDFDTNKVLEPSWVYRHDLKSGDKIVLAKPKLPSYYVPKLSSTGTHIIYSRSDIDPAGEQIWLVDVEGKEDQEIINLGDKAKVKASWCPDGKRIVVVGEHKKYRRLGIWSLRNKQLDWLIDDPKRNIEYAHMPRHSKHIVIEGVKNARSVVSLLNPDTLEENPLPIVPHGNLTAIAPLSDGEKWVGVYYGSTQPRDLVLYSLNDQFDTHKSITKVWSRTKLSPKHLVQAENFNWKSVDGLKIQGWLYRTKLAPKGTIVCVHGGPSGHSQDSLDPEIQYYLSLGFNVLDPNYRGSTGFSLSFQESIKKEGWGGLEQEDTICGVKTLIEAGIAQKGKVGVTGTSYGGYSTWHAITHYPIDLIAAAAPICGMTDLVIDYETTRPDLRPYSEEMMGGKPSDIPEKYKERSPINYVKNIKGKLLIVQGLRDPNVSPENVREVEKALQTHKVAHEKLMFEDEGHGISKLKNKQILYTKLADFFKQSFKN